jgi:hypothetical protein
MSDENMVTLKEYIDHRFASLEKTTNLVREDLDHRLAETNRVREQLREQAATFITRTDHDKLAAEVSGLREYRASLEGKASQMQVNVAFLVGLIGLLLSLAGLLLRLGK